MLAAPIVAVRAQSIDTSFKTDIANYGISGTINAVAVQPDNKIIIGGNFYTVTNVVCDGLARLNPDGTLDTSFNASAFMTPDDKITDIAVQSDGKVLVAGTFRRWNGVKVVGRGIVRLHSDGALDTDFHPDDLPPPWSTWSMALQPDGKIVLGWVREHTNAEWQFSLSRLNPDGHTDPTFNCNLLTWKMIYDVVVQPDGKVVVVGGYYQTNLSNLFMRFNTDGSEDTAFNTTAQVVGTTFIKTVAISPAGDIFIGGTFEKCNGVTRMGIAKFGSDGQLKLDFNTTHTRNSGTNALHLLSNGKILAAGDYVFTEPVFSHFVQLNADGSPDNLYPDFSGPYSSHFALIKRIVPYSSGKLFLVGDNLTLDRLPRCNLVRINPDVTIDQTFRIRPGLEGGVTVSALGVQADKKVIIGGNFHYVDNIPRNHIARINFDGSIDPSFNPGTGANREVYAIYIQPDGKILVAGAFTYFNQQLKMHLVRLNQDGSVDPSFNIDGSNVEYLPAIALQSDGKIIVKAYLKTSNKAQIIRLNADGTVDASFVSLPFSSFNSFSVTSNYWRAVMQPMAIQSDGKIVTENLRFNTDGSRDLSFQPKSGIFFAALEPDNKMIMRGGDYGYTSESFDGLHRVNPDGSLNQIFDFDFQEHLIMGLYMQPNKKILVSRQYEGGPPGVYFHTARLNADGTIDASYNGAALTQDTRLVLMGHDTDLVLVAGASNPFPTNTATALLRLKTTTRLAQAITFTAIPVQTFTSSPLNIGLSATSSAGLPVTLEVIGGAASISGNTLTVTAPGLISVKASQPGNGEYDAATPVVNTFYAKKNQAITFTAIPIQTFASSPLNIGLSVISSAGLPVTLDVIGGAASISGNTLTVTAPGLISVKASQPGNDEYAAATPVVNTFYAKKNQQINFIAIEDKVFASGMKVDLSATASSALPVTFQIISGAGTITGQTLTITGSGKITVKALQTGNDSFFPAEATRTFYARQTQLISFPAIVSSMISSPPLTFNLQATATSNLIVSFERVSGPATLSGKSLTISGAGTITIKSQQPGNDYFLPAAEVIQSFCIYPLTPTIETAGTLLVSSNNANNQWFRNGIPIPNAIQQDLQYTEPGEYTVQTSILGCSSAMSASVIITGVEAKENFSVTLYPNPATHTLSVELTNTSKSGVLVLYNALGKKIVIQNIQTSNQIFKKDLSVESLPRGMYVLEIVFPNAVFTKKIILH